MSRELCINKLNEYIENLEESRIIENSIYEYTKDQAKTRGICENIEDKFFLRIYVNKLRQLYDNMNPDSYIKNKNFLIKIKNGDYDLKNIAFLTPQDMHDEHWKPYIERQQAAIELSKNRIAGVRTDAYKCAKCKLNDCSYYMVQSRSCDEPASTHVHCLNCGHHWVFN